MKLEVSLTHVILLSLAIVPSSLGRPGAIQHDIHSDTLESRADETLPLPPPPSRPEPPVPTPSEPRASSPSEPDAPTPSEPRASSPPVGGLGRDIYVIVDTLEAVVLEDPVAGKLHPTHASILFGASLWDVPMEITVKPVDGNTETWGVFARYGSSRVEDMNEERPGADPPPDPRWIRRAALLSDNCGLTNEDILDPRSGRGIAADVWGAAPFIRIGSRAAKPSHGPLNFVMDLLRHSAFRDLRWKKNSYWQLPFLRGMRYWQQQSTIQMVKRANRIYTAVYSNPPSRKKFKIPWRQPQQPNAPSFAASSITPTATPSPSSSILAADSQSVPDPGGDNNPAADSDSDDSLQSVESQSSFWSASSSTDSSSES